jgi:hypothetical protein
MSEPTLQDDVNIWLDNYKGVWPPSLHVMLAEMQNEFCITSEDAFYYYRMWV